jgi:hypothetical protein
MLNFVKIFNLRVAIITLIVLCYLPVIGQKKANYFLNDNKYYLKGTFQKYHAALGSGDGILLKIELPVQIFKKNYTVDSFFIEKKYFPITIIETDNKKYAEINIFQSKNPISSDMGEAVSQNNFENLSFEKIKSSLMISKNGVNRSLQVSGYSEITNLSKY